MYYKIQVITKKDFDKMLREHDEDAIFDAYKPRGRFLMRDGNKFIGVDNSSGDAFTEEFDTLKECVSWLNGDFEVV